MKNLLILLLCYCCFGQNNLQSGPMLGYVEMSEAMIWLQTKTEAQVIIEYFEENKTKEIYTTQIYNTKKENGFTCHVLLDKIKQGKKYFYTIYIDKKRIELPYETSFHSKKLWQWREDAPDFSVALGSCAYIAEEAVDRPGKPYGSEYFIFESIANKNPDIMLWGGDNVYLREVDWDTKTGIYHRYSHSRSIKEVQPLLAKAQNYAIWDDHDFGPNDADRGFYHKYQTQEAFKNFWANKTYGQNPNQKEGIYSTFYWGDAQFFLLDNRFFKSPNDRKTGEKSLLGKEQLEWLIDNLSSSRASFKIIVIGGQSLHSEAIFENYENYKTEKDYLLKEIKDNGISGVMFISGDRHFSELSELKREGTYSLLDWTVSPLTSGFGSLEKNLKEKNTNRVEGSMFSQHVFGMIYFSGKKENRQIKLTLYDNLGKELWNKIILKKELN